MISVCADSLYTVKYTVYTFQTNKSKVFANQYCTLNALRIVHYLHWFDWYDTDLH